MMRGQAFTAVAALVLVACGAAGGADGNNGTPRTGAEIFNTQCALCHGRDGRLGINGAKDLTASALSQADMVAIVAHGKGGMAPFEHVLAPDEIERVVEHVRTLAAPKAE
jgi:cytochrome c6